MALTMPAGLDADSTVARACATVASFWATPLAAELACLLARGSLAIDVDLCDDVAELVLDQRLHLAPIEAAEPRQRDARDVLVDDELAQRAQCVIHAARRRALRLAAVLVTAVLRDQIDDTHAADAAPYP